VGGAPVPVLVPVSVSEIRFGVIDPPGVARRDVTVRAPTSYHPTDPSPRPLVCSGPAPVTDILRLDPGGRGVSDLSWDPQTRGYLLVAAAARRPTGADPVDLVADHARDRAAFAERFPAGPGACGNRPRSAGPRCRATAPTDAGGWRTKPAGFSSPPASPGPR